MSFPSIRCVDYHTGGEPFRIVPEPGVDLPGDGVADRRERAMASAEADGLRRRLCFEPRGHADMYGGFVTPPDDDGADLGVLFWHKDGFSTACGHGTIALGVWAVETGLVTAPSTGTAEVRIDVPSGRVLARVHRRGGRVDSVDFVNVASHAVTHGLSVTMSRGTARVDVGFGGAIYAQVRAADVGLSVSPQHYTELIAAGREVKASLTGSEHARHPTDPRLSGIYGTILYDELGTDAEGRLVQRNVTIFADGEVDRSPCGSGTAARVAVLDASGELGPDQVLVHESIVGSVFEASVLRRTEVAGRPGVVPQVRGTAYRTGEHVFSFDPRDPLVPGFVLR